MVNPAAEVGLDQEESSLPYSASQYAIPNQMVVERPEILLRFSILFVEKH